MFIVLFFTIFIARTAVVKADGPEDTKCSTVNGTTCVFPFYHGGKQYNSCTTRESAVGIPWCRTVKLDPKFQGVLPESWDYCTSACKVLSTVCKPVTKECSCNSQVKQVCHEMDENGEIISTFCVYINQGRIQNVNTGLPACNLECQDCLNAYTSRTGGLLFGVCNDMNCIIFAGTTALLCLVCIVLLVLALRARQKRKYERPKSIQPGDLFFG
ncbi:uncharacterized protein LOC111711532 [Eurytemora carolleeae]|uniref:uncharacterized protein LOC111711532 n=1 Tax=Eurytemora carolleeae TaxID=1294199 RepID=UPI000C769CD8|nr:uncharacterized protein LOC111711532 [Eurytemora carolleeae]|eukprot:XP_023341681.1 uncharacterized protein LOC111711532 [Eurytemora affinis]